MASRQLVWFRTDLRTIDHTALAHAAEQGPVIGVIVRTLKQWRNHGHGANKLDFWQRGIGALAEQLKALRIPLEILDADTFDSTPTSLLKLARELQVEALHFNDEYGLNEQQRDRSVQAKFSEVGIAVHRYTDQVLFTPGTLKTGSGDYYSVFTPFLKAWLKQISATQLAQREAPTRQAPLSDVTTDQLPALPERDQTTSSIREFWPAGEEAAADRLASFLDARANHYKEYRDFPETAATSELSPYIALGMISPRQCINAAAARNHGHLGDGDKNLTSWISELVWREFYQHLLVGYPRLSRGEPYKLETRRVPWRDNDEDFSAWCEGRTGYPLVDAAMKQLTSRGWMHNRLRMVTAMFLTKHLLIHWHRGEQFFLKHLVDGELGSNNGGWQWAASTGTDAAPYFRIFNPTTQARRFDPEGEFIARYLPELADLSPRDRHDPKPQQRREIGYPDPIVDHRAARQRALDAFSSSSDD
ncbi:deoxyribodipyrimidine photo-lyase [Kushneria phosphatilytica]|uniref:deoxyribodipyrimidine photo-lyase n=1 Tax=Kushneria phosphatilytica TaxID=657387 RepID=UPI0008DA534D|nr:deoxyribodipyrimidine photo-lyase [Kushneria phosphatilytica]OHV11511.1 deoxyribodipyrimidine photolyase [Kushneria phosphatilytica]